MNNNALLKKIVRENHFKNRKPFETRQNQCGRDVDVLSNKKTCRG